MPYVYHIRFRWPNSIQDAIVQQRDPPMYAFTSAFKSALHDLSLWAVDSDLLDIFPDIARDVTTYGPRVTRLWPQQTEKLLDPDTDEEQFED
jgi:hypothetical protein